MKYEIKFPNSSLENKFEKMLLKIPERNVRQRITKGIEVLADNPRPDGKKTKKLKPPVHLYNLTAEYRLRIGNYRVLYDIDDSKKIVWILVLRKRSEKSYK